MAENFENKATRGSISQIIFTALSTGNKYGYEICKDIERLTNGKLILKQPSLYSSLRRMEEQNLISSYWEDSSLGGRRHYYSLTEKGKQTFESNKNIWKNQEELLNSLPENLNNKFQEEETNFVEELVDDNKESTLVANQENLFNLTRNINKEIRKINAEEESEKASKSFLQFDFFEQDIKFVKNEKTNQEVSAFTNKFSDMDNHSEEIEPESILKNSNENTKVSKNENLNVLDLNFKNFNNSEDFSTPNNKKITREEVFSTSLITKTENDTKIKEKKVELTEVTTFNEKDMNNSIEENNKDINITASLEKIEWKDNNIVETDKPIFENKDYRGLIGKLYNNSQLKDPYEQNKYNSFKEIFPSSQLKMKENDNQDEVYKETALNNIVQSSSDSNIACDDIKMLNSLYNLQGINIKTHSDIENKKQNKVYTDKNRLNMVTSWILTFIMLIEVLGTYFILHKQNLLVKGQSIMYFLGVAVTISICLIFTLENIFDRFKLVIIDKTFSKMFILRLLIFIIMIVLIFALNLAFGMNNLLQVEYLSYWLLPTLLSTNLLLYVVIYYCLLKSKNFNS